MPRLPIPPSPPKRHISSSCPARTCRESFLDRSRTIDSTDGDCYDDCNGAPDAIAAGDGRYHGCLRHAEETSSFHRSRQRPRHRLRSGRPTVRKNCPSRRPSHPRSLPKADCSSRRDKEDILDVWPPSPWPASDRSSVELSIVMEGISSAQSVPPIERRVTVANQATDRLVYYLTLDEAIAVSLSNVDVIRIVTGNIALNSGSTIYDAAITNTQVDQARGRFDPVFGTQNTVEGIESPGGIRDILVPEGARIDGVRLRSFRHRSELSQTKAGGGTASLRFDANPRRSDVPAAALNPETATSLELGYVQPLLRGRGIDVNQAPIVIARISTERSLYQVKSALQQQINSLIGAYWSIVFARTDSLGTPSASGTAAVRLRLHRRPSTSRFRRHW